MKRVLKQWKVMSLIVCMLFMVSSYTAIAQEEVLDHSAVIHSDESTTELIRITEDNTEIEFADEDFPLIYTGEEIRPEIKVVITLTGSQGEELVLGEECYKIEYRNNVNATTEGEYAEITVTGIEEKGYTGTVREKFAIEPRTINDAHLKLAKTKYIYDGKYKTPSLSLILDDKILEKDKDYMVIYSDNQEVGTAYATVEGIGNYAGEQKAEYKIALGKVITANSGDYSKIQVIWSKIPGASGYELYRSTVEGIDYKKIATITSGTANSYTDTDVVFNTTYYYAVKAYRIVNGKNVYADMSLHKAQTVQLATPVISKITRNSATSLKIAWNKVDGASGYVVYRSTSENGEYTKLKYISNNNTFSYTDDSVSCGRTYYYKVRPYRNINGKGYYGLYSDAKSGYAAPGSTSWDSANITFTATSVKLKWKKVTEASGYEIYRSEEQNGTYSKVKTISSNNTLSWENTGLEKGKAYYYKIRSYKTVDSKAVYSGYSSIYAKGVGGWRYENGYKLYYNDKGKLVKDVSNLIGKQDSYVIKVNKKKNTVTVYAKDGKNGYIIPVKAFICSTGAATPLGTFYTPQKLRWHTLDGPSYGQWCTRITGSILFHSVWYYQPKNTTLSVAQYNKLGTQASHGCVRLTAGDAKWIYDNCKLKTKVVIYNGNSAGPLGKPTAYKLPSWHTWDPTDPNVKSKCKKKGCH